MNKLCLAMSLISQFFLVNFVGFAIVNKLDDESYVGAAWVCIIFWIATTILAVAFFDESK